MKQLRKSQQDKANIKQRLSNCRIPGYQSSIQNSTYEVNYWDSAEKKYHTQAYVVDKG